MKLLGDELEALGIPASDWPDALADSRAMEFEVWAARWIVPCPPGYPAFLWRSRARDVYEQGPTAFYLGSHTN